MASVGKRAEEMAELRFDVPASWRDALQQAAHTQRIPLSNLLRMIVRGFLRERYTPEQREHLEVD
jgi:hypothetical protein